MKTVILSETPFETNDNVRGGEVNKLEPITINWDGGISTSNLEDYRSRLVSELAGAVAEVKENVLTEVAQAGIDPRLVGFSESQELDGRIMKVSIQPYWRNPSQVFSGAERCS